jgi:predicted DNA-binding transcriptional regulator AlpA
MALPNETIVHQEEAINATQLANKLGKAYRTILRWTKDELIPCHRPTRQTIWYYESEVREAIKKHRIPVKA